MEELAISIRELYMSYGSKQVLKGISIDVPKGQIIGYRAERRRKEYYGKDISGTADRL